MSRPNRRRTIGVIILLVSLVILFWGLWPYAIEMRTLPISPADMQLPQPGGFSLPLWQFV